MDAPIIRPYELLAKSQGLIQLSVSDRLTESMGFTYVLTYHSQTDSVGLLIGFWSMCPGGEC